MTTYTFLCKMRNDKEKLSVYNRGSIRSTLVYSRFLIQDNVNVSFLVCCLQTIAGLQNIKKILLHSLLLPAKQLQ